jgi:predicted permease
VIARLRAWWMRVAGMCGLGRRDRDIAEELTTHIQMIEAEYRQSGMGDGQAHRAAATAFGSVASVTDAYRDRRGLPTLERWFRDVRHAVRSLRRSPVLALSMVLVLGLGIGLSTAVAAIFDHVACRGLPVPEPDRVVKIALNFQGALSRQVRGGLHWFSYPELAEYRATANALESVAGVSQVRVTWRQDAGSISRRLSAALVSGDYFRVMRIAPARGRLLAESDSRQPVAVISHRLWMEAFGGDLSVISRTMSIDRGSYAVVGVAIDGFAGTDMNPVDVWVPLEAAIAIRGDAGLLSQENVSWLQVIGRLASDAPITAAAAESGVIAARLDQDYPGRHTTIALTQATLLDSGLLQPRGRGTLIGVGTAGALTVMILLLICGSNVAALLLARGATRQREVALRIALGAGRGHVAQELVAEVLVIVGAGAVAGVAVYSWSLRAFASWMPPQVRDLLSAPAVDERVLVFVAGTALVVALLFGLAPLRQALKVDCLAGLKGSAPMRAVRLRQWLVSGQVAVSVALLIAAALLGRGLDRAFHLDPGYSTKNLYVVRPDVESARGEAAAARRWEFMKQLRDRLAETPGVTAVSVTTIPPFSGTGVSSARKDPMPAPVPVRFNTVGDDYFATLGISPTAGRFFLPNERNVVLINSILARNFWGSDRAAIGQRMELPGVGAGDSPRLTTVVGVVPTIQTTDVGVPDEPSYFLPVSSTYLFEDAALIVRTADGVSLPRLALGAIREQDRRAFGTVVSLDERIAANTEPVRVVMAMAGLIGLLALLVAGVGIHGIIAHAVTSQTRDIGVYLALGASRLQVLRVVLGQTVAAAAIGALAGCALLTGLGVAFSGPVKEMLFGLTPLDPIALLIGTGIFLGAALVAAYLPARRALSIQPSEALRRGM